VFLFLKILRKIRGETGEIRSLSRVNVSRVVSFFSFFFFFFFFSPTDDTTKISLINAGDKVAGSKIKRNRLGTRAIRDLLCKKMFWLVFSLDQISAMLYQLMQQ